MPNTFEDGRVVVHTGLVEVDGKPFQVSAQTRVEALVDSPRIMLWLGLLGLSLLLIPAMLVAATLVDTSRHSWLMAFPSALAAISIARILTATTRYHVALVADSRTRVVFSSDDLQRVVFLVAMLRDAIPVRGGRTARGTGPETTRGA
jgi:hypothetical protein